ncbi:MAG: WG repeat-containing protein [Muribaculaceae bacterium]|nr:WG repeat-containing protein [Muribaculaceae bacterium]
MKLSKAILAVLAVGALAPTATAETARWLIKPEYQAVYQMTDKLYKVKQSIKSGIVSVDGRKIVPLAYDSITPFSEGLALVLNATPEGKMRILGVVTEDGTMSNVNDELYTDQFPFFSEGLLPVANAKGKVGYVDRNMRAIVPFKFSNPHPFSNGLAAVSKDKGILGKALGAVGGDGLIGTDKVYYINQFGKELKLPREIGDIYLGTTFKNGEALVMNKDRQCFIINPMGSMLRMDAISSLKFDEKYCLITPDDEKAAAQGTVVSPITIYNEGQLYGYKSGDKIIIPAQFTSAGKFTDGRAVAAKFKQFGIIDLISGNVDVKIKKGTAPATDDMESAIIDVTVPKGLAPYNVTADVYDSVGKLAGTVSGAANETGRHTLPLMLPKGDRVVRVSVDGLEIWNSTIKPPVEKTVEVASEDGIEISFASTKAKANSNDAAAITVTVTNTGSKPYSAAVRASGASASVKRVNIKAGGKATINLYFSKVTKSETRNVTITVGDHSASRKISLEPFFTF